MPAQRVGAARALVGVDVGSTHIKAVLVAPGSGVLHVARRATDTHAVRGGGAYHRPAELLAAVADAIAFLLLALLVMAAAAFLGAFLSRTFRSLGLGCLEGFAGAIFGFFQGIILVTLCMIAIVAFFPKAHVLSEARLPRMFFGACHLSTHVTPQELAQRIREGLRTLEEETPEWMHPRQGTS